MRPAAVSLVLAAVVALPCESARAQTPEVPRAQYSPLAAEQARQPHQQPQTWYEFALGRINPGNVDYGRLLEERRRAFLHATIDNPYFVHDFVTTILVLLLMAICTKLLIDRARSHWLMGEMTADMVSHDERSRRIAREAIQKYNDHIDRCNRVVEAQESGHALPVSGSEVDSLRQKLMMTGEQLEVMTKDRDKHKSDLDEKTRLVSQLSMRVDELSKLIPGGGSPSRQGAQSSKPATEDSEPMRLMRHINALQTQLESQRRENERLRGGR